MVRVKKYSSDGNVVLEYGTFGIVLRGCKSQDHAVLVAIKHIKKEQQFAVADGDIEYLKRIEHDNIVSILDHKIYTHQLCLVMNYCNGGSFYQYLRAESPLTAPAIKVFLRQMSEAMLVLNSNGIIHGDLKPENVLLGFCTKEKAYPSAQKITFKITDFGLPRLFERSALANRNRGFSGYRAPEAAAGWNEKMDLWSIGVIILECLQGTSAFREQQFWYQDRFQENIPSYLTQGPPKSPSRIPKELKHLLSTLLVINPDQRMNCVEFSKHPFLEVIEIRADNVQPCLIDLGMAHVPDLLLEEENDLVQYFSALDVSGE